jgi:hypothetical protein
MLRFELVGWWREQPVVVVAVDNWSWGENHWPAGRRVVRPNACVGSRGPLASVYAAGGGGEPTRRQKSSGW